ncbi:MAG: spore maturation protein [Muribaculum sp.]|nr:spore maturation protein [Muribaculum sp.]
MNGRYLGKARLSMNAFIHLSDIIIPLILFFVVSYGMVSKVKVYESFLNGAKDGLKIVVDIVPTLIGLLVAVGVLRASGIFELLGVLLSPLTEKAGLPAQLIPLLAVKLFSSSAATGLVLDIFKTYGPDSYAGLVTSILMSCTETVFYTMSVYFLAAKVTKTRYTLTGALLATLAGTAASVVLAGRM